MYQTCAGVQKTGWSERGLFVTRDCDVDGVKKRNILLVHTERVDSLLCRLVALSKLSKILFLVLLFSLQFS